MPEYPDVIVYLEALERHVVGRPIQKVLVKGISVLKSYDPPISTLKGMAPTGTRRLGKRLILTFDDDLFLVIHLMVAGRLWWRDADAKTGSKTLLAAIQFEHGSLHLTEAASIHGFSANIRDIIARDYAISYRQVVLSHFCRFGKLAS